MKKASQPKLFKTKDRTFVVYKIQGKRPWRLTIQAREPLPWDYETAVEDLRKDFSRDALALAYVLLEGLPAGTIDALTAILTNQQRRRRLEWRRSYERKCNAKGDAGADRLAAI